MDTIMAGYTKLFSDILMSTIWRENDETRLVWITMLALTDAKGVVRASVPGLADAARVSLEKCVEALEKMKSPDEWSRSKEESGRRIREVDGGWEIINYMKYRNRLSVDDRREYLRVKQAEFRARKKAVPGGKGPSGREQRYVKADGDGDLAGAGKIAAEGLPGKVASEEEGRLERESAIWMEQQEAIKASLPANPAIEAWRAKFDAAVKAAEAGGTESDGPEQIPEI